MTNKTLEERFFEKVHINTESGCWEWTAHRNSWYLDKEIERLEEND